MDLAVGQTFQRIQIHSNVWHILKLIIVQDRPPNPGRTTVKNRRIQLKVWNLLKAIFNSTSVKCHASINLLFFHLIFREK